MIHAKIMGNNNVTADFAVRMVRGMGSLYGGPQWTSCFHHSSMTLNKDNKKLDKLELFSLRIPGAQSLLLDISMSLIMIHLLSNLGIIDQIKYDFFLVN
jgi:hypothetical protein